MFSEHDKSLTYWRKRAYQSIFIAIWFAIGLCIAFLSKPVWSVFVALFMGVLFYYLLSAPVSFLARYIRSRVFAIVIILLGAIFGIAMLGVYLTPLITTQLKEFSSIVPYLLGELKKTIFVINGYLASYRLEIPAHYLNEDEFIDTVLPMLSKFKVTDFGSNIGSFLMSSMSTILYTVLSLVFSFYLLIDGQRAWEIMVLPFNKRFQMHLNAIRARINVSLHAFILGQFQIASMTASVMLVTYSLLGSTYAILLATVQLLEIVPVIGTWVAIVPSLAVIAYTSGSTKFLIALGVYLFYTQIIRDNFLAPRILGDALGFHPLGVIVSFAI